MSEKKEVPPGGWKDFWKTPMPPGERAKWLRDSETDVNLLVEQLKEDRDNARATAWEKERYGL
jgi:hypothetical protein